MKLVASGLLLAALALAWTIPSSWAADNDIVVGFAIAQSGWMSENDGPPSQGALMAIDDINAKGGLLGRKIRPVFADTKSDQTQGAEAGESVLAQGAKLMIVSCDYDMGAGAATVGNDHKIPTFSLCASDAKMGVQGIGPYAFTIANASLTIGATLAQWGVVKKGWKNAYLLLDDTIEYNKGICSGFETQWKRAGGTIVGQDSFKQDDASIASQVTNMQQTNANSKIDFIMICSHGAGDVSAVRQIRSAGIETPIGGGDSMDGDFWTKAVPHLNDHYASTLGSPFGDDPRPFVNQFMDRMAKADGHRPPTSLAISGYSVVQALALAVQRANSLDGDAVLAQLNKFHDENLAIGPTTFTPDLHINLTRPQAILGIRDGKGYFVDLVQLPAPPPLKLIFKHQD
ncbi:ABC transporter substrate-binding protein [Acidisoma cellulosilytica]|uniref:ABC transporter substrate-binding protein n=1 Tax=Acidisoma cellulosilyticum TaxID=2802395 RepID=A0A963Z2N8_9PROT|nr:ABC transporter substrate-binding protein [Acidisoma cellulosilyticum]MCB8881424.1 ABC transporter substrate-binding protein [Acidisoma cellulosilyticum]